MNRLFAQVSHYPIARIVRQAMAPSGRLDRDSTVGRRTGLGSRSKDGGPPLEVPR